LALGLAKFDFQEGVEAAKIEVTYSTTASISRVARHSKRRSCAFQVEVIVGLLKGGVPQNVKVPVGVCSESASL
jgi:hypothetical protein